MYINSGRVRNMNEADMMIKVRAGDFVYRSIAFWFFSLLLGVRVTPVSMGAYIDTKIDSSMMTQMNLFANTGFDIRLEWWG
ncbi:hypothetical protein BpHYR1_003883 [Brachionus plicatilis]|uniref:Uncharacterized protein n=1 Tax=Brachionus plicatilis TaxID=10195 RepID=A0A3M7Q5V3_BRAPC|nr:hypothetical protein BpHYR1_003883 [Brachionus plicatilis]